MGLSVQFTPLYGAKSDSRAHSYLLSVAGAKILLDCGWNSDFHPEAVTNALRPHLASVDLVLLSHSHLHHLGALPYAFAHLGLRKTTPVYSTLPVWRMGQMALYDAYQSVSSQREFDLFTLDDVDAAFETRGASARFHLLKYHQGCVLNTSDSRGLVITPQPAGHLLGGSVWTIQADTESIVYAVDINHRRELHLNATTLASIPRPSVLIFGAANSPTRTRTLRTSHLFNPILDTLRNGGNVLVPVDTAGRVVELAVELNEAWVVNRLALSSLQGENRPGNAKPHSQQQLPALIVLHEFSSRTFDFARTMIEFMSDRVVKKFDTTRENLFDFKHLRCCHSRAQLDDIPGPKVVLASSSDMEIGFARDLFIEWAPESTNTLVLVDRPEPGTLASRLAQFADDGNSNAPLAAVGTKRFNLDLTIQRKERLSGDELHTWREQRRTQEKQKMKQDAIEKTSARGSGTENETVAFSTAPSTPGAVHATEARGTVSSKRGSEQTSGNFVASPAVQDGSASLGSLGDSKFRGTSDRRNSHDSESSSDSSSDDDDDDGEYDTDLIMGAAGARRSGGGQLLGGRKQVHGPSSTILPTGNMSMLGGGLAHTGSSPFASLVGAQSHPQPPAGNTAGAATTSVHISANAESQNGSRSRWDDYGQSIGLNRFAIGEDPSTAIRSNPGLARPESASGPRDPMCMADAQNLPKIDLDEYHEDIPIKVVTQEMALEVACRVFAIDRSGLSEGDALKHMVKELEPRRVILVNGTRDETSHLYGHLSQSLSATSPSGNHDPNKTANSRLRAKFLALNRVLKKDPANTGAPGAVKGWNLANSHMAGKVSDPGGPFEPLEPQDSIVVAPAAGQDMDVTSVTSVHEVVLDRSIVANLQWSTLGGSSVAYVDGVASVVDKAENLDANDATAHLPPSTDATSSSAGAIVRIGPVDSMGHFSLENRCRDSGPIRGDSVEDRVLQDIELTSERDTAGGSAVDEMDVCLVPEDACGEFLRPPAGHPTIFVGTIMLGRLKEAMWKAGIRAELADGVLYIHNNETGAVVLVKKVGAQNLVIEGALSEEYYAVRDVVYRELVVVSA